jgi:hypothetical protein
LVGKTAFVRVDPGYGARVIKSFSPELFYYPRAWLKEKDYNEVRVFCCNITSLINKDKFSFQMLDYENCLRFSLRNRCHIFVSEVVDFW